MLKTSIIEINLNELNLSTDPLSQGIICGTMKKVQENKRVKRYKKNNMRRLKSTHLLMCA
jgi:hypothetical protein